MCKILYFLSSHGNGRRAAEGAPTKLSPNNTWHSAPRITTTLYQISDEKFSILLSEGSDLISLSVDALCSENGELKFVQK